MDKNFYGSEKLGFRQIVLEHLRKVLDLNLKIGSPDSAIQEVKAYRNSILGLSDILLPFYDKDMEEAYKNYEKEYKKVSEKTCENGNIKNPSLYMTLIKKVHRELFRALNLLLKRNDYLKESVYGEEKQDDIVIDEEEE